MKRVLLIAISVLSFQLGQAQVDWDWATAHGASGASQSDGVNSIVTDEVNGGIFVTGYFSGNASLFGVTKATAGSNDIYVARLGTDGSLDWLWYGGSVGQDEGFDLAYDSVHDKLYIIFTYSGAIDFFDELDNAGLSYGHTGGGSDVGIMTLNGLDGSTDVDRSFFFGATGNDVGRGIEVDVVEEKIYVTGEVKGGTINFTGGPSITGDADGDFFLVKWSFGPLNADWAYQSTDAAGTSPGAGAQRGWDLAVNYDGNGDSFVYAIGDYEQNLNFDHLGGVFNIPQASQGAKDIFLVSYFEDGTAQAATWAGTTGTDFGLGIETSPVNGVVFATGKVSSNSSVTTELQSGIGTNGGDDIWIGRFDEVTLQDEWFRVVGDVGNDRGEAITVTDSGSPIVTGYFDGTVSFPIGGGTVATVTSVGGSLDRFLARLDKADGGAKDVARTGGSGNDGASFGRAGIDMLWGKIISGGFISSTDADFGSLTVVSSGTNNLDFYVGSYSRFFVDINDPFVELDNSRADWGDMDGDGDLDVAITGVVPGSSPASYETYVYTNSGNDSFFESFMASNGRDLGSIEWIDWDGDQDLDLFLYGNGSGAESLFINNGSGFTQVDIGLPTATNGKASLGDVDNDSDIDVIITNSSGDPYITQYFQNNNGSLTLVDIGIPNIAYGVVELADLDADGDLDLMLAGLSGNDASSVPTIQVLLNVNGRFDDAGSTAWTGSLTEAGFADIEFGDINRDGKLDAVVMGDLLTADPNIQVYINSGTNSFTTNYSVGSGLADGSVDLGDYDNDGDTDILVTGWDSGDIPQTIIYKNDGTGAFFEIDPQMIGVAFGNGHWGDYDGDGDLDVLILGQDDQFDMNFDIYRNDGTLSFNAAPPNTPSGLTSTVNGNTVTLAWNTTGGDVITFDEALTYNLRIGTSPGTADIIAPSSLTGGKRLITRGGNVDQNTSWTVTLPQDGTFYWSVQVIDQGFVGSAFATEQSFTIDAAVTFTEFTTLHGNSSMDYKWLNYNGDASMDLVSIGDGYRIFTNDGANNFTETGLGPFFQYGTVDVGDFNFDNAPDLLASGYFPPTADHDALSIWDLSTGSFLQTTADGIETTHWGDFNNDGALDFFEAGASSKLHFVDPSVVNTSNPVGDLSFVDLTGSAADVGDYDNDGDLDILYSGVFNSSRSSILYRNDGNNVFTDAGLALKGLEGNVNDGIDAINKLVDYDSDGDLDIVLMGDDDLDIPNVLFYNNDGTGVFTEDTNLGDLNVNLKKMDFGDYDNDGDLDIIGIWMGGTAYIYERNAGSYTQVGNFLVGSTEFGAGEWGDFDNDGDLDLVLTQNDGGGGYFTQIYRNDQSVVNAPPSVPTNLGFSQEGDTIRLFWDGSTDDVTPGAAITYNVYVGSTSGAIDIVSPMAHTQGADAGLRFVAEIGNAGFTEEFIIKASNLTPGDHFWSVQAIDGAYKGSAFATESTFTYAPVDDDAPEITPGTFPTVHLLGGGGTTVTANIVDPSGSDFQASIIYLKVTEFDTDLSEEDFEFSTLNPDENGDVSFTFNDVDFDEIGILFIITAEDVFTNYDETSVNFISVQYNALSVTNISVGKEETNYRLVAFPQKPAPVGEVFESFGTPDKTKWRLYRWTGTAPSEITSASTNLNPGEGYWFITNESDKFPVLNGEAVDVSFDQPFQINLGSGWNAVGNPYNFDLDWRKVATFNALDGTDISTLNGPWFYRGGWSDNQDVIGEFEGVYVENTTGGSVTIKVPPFIQSVPTSTRTKEMKMPLDSDEWFVRLNLRNESTYYEVPVIGMHPDASIGTDRFDGAALPHLAKQFDLLFDNHGAPISRDMVETSDNYTWNFEVRSDYEGEVTKLEWDNTYFGDNEKQLFLKDLQTQQLIDMRTASNHIFSVKDKREFAILFGDQAYIKENGIPDKAAISAIYPNPATNNVNIAFTLPKSEVLMDVTMELIDVMGREITEVYSGKLGEGYHQISWDRTLRSGSKAVNGVYLLKLNVEGHSYTQRLILK